MSEPITLYKGGHVFITSAPSVALELQAQGWSLEAAIVEDDDVPITFGPAEDEEKEPEPEPEPKPVRRGRKPKAQK